MRQRITFVHPPGAGVDPAALVIQDAKLQGPAAEAVLEHKLTLTLQELPSELAGLLRDVHELHLRWTSPSSYGTLEPFSSRLSPGLHLSCAPLQTDTHDPFVYLKTSTQSAPRKQRLMARQGKALLPFTGVWASRLHIPRGRHAGLPALYFYQRLENLNSFIEKATPAACSEHDAACEARLQDLRAAVSLDISYDSASKTVKLVAFWPLGEHGISVVAPPNGRTEVGILGRDVPAAIEPHEVGVSGILTVVGEQKEPSPVLFAFPSRHRTSHGSFSSRFLAPTGLHPTLQLSLSTNQPPVEDAECAPHVYLTLPREIFADKYQLADELFLASKNLTAARYVSQPVDLEAPAYTTATWGSNVLLELASPSAGAASNTWTVEVPLHLRYLKPSATGEVDIDIPYPVVFWACEAGEGADFANSPFDRVNLGYDSLFGPTTAFWHVSPKPGASGRLMNPITVPVVKDEASQWVGLGTAVAVGLGFVWVSWKLLGAYRASGYGNAAPKGHEDRKKE